MCFFDRLDVAHRVILFFGCVTCFGNSCFKLCIGLEFNIKFAFPSSANDFLANLNLDYLGLFDVAACKSCGKGDFSVSIFRQLGNVQFARFDCCVFVFSNSPCNFYRSVSFTCCSKGNVAGRLDVGNLECGKFGVNLFFCRLGCNFFGADNFGYLDSEVLVCAESTNITVCFDVFACVVFGNVGNGCVGVQAK